MLNLELSASGKSIIKCWNIRELSNLFYNLHFPYDTYFIRLSLFPCFKTYSQKFFKPYFLALMIGCVNFGLGLKNPVKDAWEQVYQISFRFYHFKTYEKVVVHQFLFF